MAHEKGLARAVDVEPVMEWLVGGPVGNAGEVVLARFGPELVRCGIRLTRIAAFVRTLHPFIMGRRFVWQQGKDELEVLQAPYELLSTDEYKNSPSGQVCATGRDARWRLEGDAPLPYAALREQRDAGMTDYIAAPLHFLSGEVHAITYSTDVAGGFSDAEVRAIQKVTPALARVAEILALTRTAANLLDAYVGHHAGARILAGRVRRGETELIDCVIWFSDLRGFTTLSAGQPPAMTVQVLNRLFDCQVPAVERHGGEVLKFIGDGMLAIFRVPDPSKRADVVREALVAAKEAFAALDLWNGERSANGDTALRFGLAIHAGEVGYGNIGGAGRLDFTCIGPAVNLAARVEGLAAKLGKRLLLTEAVAEVANVRVRRLGAYEVKGVTPAPVVFELEDGWSILPSPP